MEPCGNCGKKIVFGGEQNRFGRFCNDTCVESNLVNRVRAAVPAEKMEAHVAHAAQCGCAVCGSSDPIDVYEFSTIYSLILFTSSQKRQIVSCRKCGRKRQLFAFVISFVCGWWGFPWGLLKTPFVLLENLIAMAKGAPAKPTFRFSRVVELSVARDVLLVPDPESNEWAEAA